MSSQPPLPVCPACGRKIAAWKKEHCVYCGVDRPPIPPDAARKLEMMKVVPLEGAARARALPAWIGLLSLPVFAVIFYLLYSIVRRYIPSVAGLVLVVGAGILGYFIYAFYKARR